MIRKFVAASVALMVCASGLLAAEYRGRIKAVDPEKNTITITIKKDDKTFNVAKDAKLTHSNKKQQARLSAEGLKYFATAIEKSKKKRGPVVTIVTKGEGAKEVVTEIRAGKQAKKPKNDK